MTTKPPHNYTRLAMVAAVAALVLSLTAAAAGFPAQQAIVKPVNGGSTSSSSSIANSAQTSAGTSSVFYFRPCNCSVNIRHLLSVYSTLGALQSSSDFVVVARVSSQTTIGVNVSSAIGTPVKGLVPVTIYNITITTVLSETSNLSAGEWQTVAQIGGTFGETTMNVTGYPSLPVGQSYVFFLTCRVS